MFTDDVLKSSSSGEESSSELEIESMAPDDLQQEPELTNINNDRSSNTLSTFLRELTDKIVYLYLFPTLVIGWSPEYSMIDDEYDIEQQCKKHQQEEEEYDQYYNDHTHNSNEEVNEVNEDYLDDAGRQFWEQLDISGCIIDTCAFTLQFLVTFIRLYMRYLSCATLIILCIFVITSSAKTASADETWRNVGFVPCTERTAPFRTQDCEYYTSITALLDLVGGGEFKQQIKTLSNPSSPIQDVLSFTNAMTTCFADNTTSCIPIIQEKEPAFEITYIRSPLPDNVPKVLEGSNQTLAFFWQLTRSEFTPNNGLPLMYGLFKDYNYIDYPELPEATAGSEYSGAQFTKNACSSVAENEIKLVTLSDVRSENGEFITEPLCSVANLGSPVNASVQFYALNETGFYSGYTKRAYDVLNHCRSPLEEFRCLDKEQEYILDDIDGTCTAICCGNKASLRVRSIGPQCFLYDIQPRANIAVDFAIKLEHPTLLPLQPLIIPIYGILQPGSDPLVLEKEGVRVRIEAVKQGFERLSNLDALQVSSGQIISCGEWNINNQTSDDECLQPTWQSALPNQISGPTGKKDGMTWRYLKSHMRGMYAQLSRSQSAFSTLFKNADEFDKSITSLYAQRSKHFGDSASLIESNIASYIQSVLTDSTEQLRELAVDVCVGIYDETTFQNETLQELIDLFIFQNIPGHTLTTNSLTGQLQPELSSFYSLEQLLASVTIPSICEVTSCTNNTDYLPPLFNNSAPNWWIRRGLEKVSGDPQAHTDSQQNYLLYAPEDYILKESGLYEQMKNALRISIDISDSLLPLRSSETESMKMYTPVSFSSFLYSSSIDLKANWFRETALYYTTPTRIFDTCHWPSVEEISVKTDKGTNALTKSPVKGSLTFQVFSLQKSREFEMYEKSSSGYVIKPGLNIQIIPPKISVVCTPITNVTKTPPRISVSPDHPQSLQPFYPGQIQTMSVDVFVDFDTSSYYEEVKVNTIKLARCEILLDPLAQMYTSNGDGASEMLIRKPIDCMVAQDASHQSTTEIVIGNPSSGGISQSNKDFDNSKLYPDKPNRNDAIHDLEQHCEGFCNFECYSNQGRIHQSACFWILVGMLTSLLIAFVVVITECIVLHKITKHRIILSNLSQHSKLLQSKKPD